MKQLLILILFFSATLAHAQTDTIVNYLNRQFKPVARDTAAYLEKEFQQNGKYIVQRFALPAVQLETESIYADAKRLKNAGDYKQFENGKLYHVETFDDKGALASAVFYFPSGAKQAEIIWSGNKTVSEKGWDEQGTEIPGYIVMREASFPGGAKAWVRFLEKNLQSDVPVRAGLRAGSYTALVDFNVDKEGYISDIVGRSRDGCRPCVEEAVRVIANGPNWVPAVMNNKKVVYRQRQSITFLVQEQ